MQVNVTSTNKKYDYAHIEPNFERNSSTNQDRQDERNFVDEVLISSLNKTEEKAKKAIQEKVLISKSQIEQILYLAVNKGVHLKNVHNYVGYHINARA